jgi:hypothetical protein
MAYFQLEKYHKLRAPAKDDKKNYKVDYAVVCTGDEAPAIWPEAGPIMVTEFHAWAETAGFEWTGTVED